MIILLIILSIIGSLKLVSLFMLCYITIVIKQKNKEINNIIKYVGKCIFVEYCEHSCVAQAPFHARGIYIEA